MNKKFREKLDSWDLRSLLLTVTFFLICIFLFFFFIDFRERFRQASKKEFKGQTNGQIISIEPIEVLTQSKWKGANITVDRYQVLYSYTVDGQTYKKADLIPTSTKNQKFIKKLLDRGPTDTFLVKFDLKDPEKSILIDSE